MIHSEDGVEKTLAILKDGSLFGEAAFFDKLPRTSSAKTLEKSEIIAISQNALIEIFSVQPNLAMTFLTYLAKTIRMLSAQVDHITFLPADRRIAQLLISLADKRQRIFSTHEEIGNLIGITRISVSRILKRFSENGWIQTKYRFIQLTNLQELKKFAFRD